MMSLVMLISLHLYMVWFCFFVFVFCVSLWFCYLMSVDLCQMVEESRRFCYLMSVDLCQMVEESRRTGKVSIDINATFFILIPKCYKPKSLDFKSISLCNLVYKLISKIISNKIKYFLARRCPPTNLALFIIGIFMVPLASFMKPFTLSNQRNKRWCCSKWIWTKHMIKSIGLFFDLFYFKLG